MVDVVASVSDKLASIFAVANRSAAPGAVVAVRKDGALLLRQGYGMASIEHGRAITPATRMRIGSTSKHFTCLAALLLAEEGKLDIDAPANRYLPELLVREMPTLRQLMNHTGGLRCSLDLAGIANGAAPIPKGWSLQAMYRQREAMFSPGSQQTYCNGGYQLLTVAIERAAEMSYEDFLKSRIFDRLGMVDTICAPSDFDIVDRIATLHVPRGGGSFGRGIFPSTEIRGEGSMVSTVDDMMLWLGHLTKSDKAIGTAQTWHQMLQPPKLSDGSSSTYALGLYRHAYRGVEIIHHGGAVIGGGCQMLTVPSHALDVVIMTNGGPINPMKAALAVVDAVIGGALVEQAVPLASTSRFGHLAGVRYTSPFGVNVAFADLAGVLGLIFMDGPPWPVLHDTGDTLRAGFEDIALGPIEFDAATLAPTQDGLAPEAISYREGGVGQVLEKVSGAPPPLPLISGVYRSADAAATARIDGERLEVNGDFSLRKFVLRSLAAHAADIVDEQGAVTAVMTFAQEDERIAGFWLDSPRARRVWFQRVEAPRVG